MFVSSHFSIEEKTTSELVKNFLVNYDGSARQILAHALRKINEVRLD